MPHQHTLSWHDARARARRAVQRLPERWTPLAAAVGATLSRPITARQPMPHFDRAAMDGYAVAGQPPWTIRGLVAMGSAPGRMSCGDAYEISTGAAVPDGAHAVLPYEIAAVRGTKLRPARAEDGIRSGAVGNIRYRGEEAAAGQQLVAAGAVVTPQLIALASSAGFDLLPVRPLPRVAVLLTGDELCHAGLAPMGRVRDALGPAMPALIEWAGGRCDAVTTVPDAQGSLTRTLDQLDADVILVCGSSARGHADRLVSSLTELGAHLLIDGVACRPGHPQKLARLDRRIIIGLPGNPLAAFVAFLTLALPLCRTLAGLDEPALTEIDGSRLTPHHRDTSIQPVRLDRSGRPWPVLKSGSAQLSGLAVADAIAVLAPVGDGRALLHPIPGGPPLSLLPWSDPRPMRLGPRASARSQLQGCTERQVRVLSAAVRGLSRVLRSG